MTAPHFTFHEKTATVTNDDGTQGYAFAYGAVSYLYWENIGKGMYKVEMQVAARVITYTLSERVLDELLAAAVSVDRSQDYYRNATTSDQT